jgi:hypothetical protein
MHAASYLKSNDIRPIIAFAKQAEGGAKTRVLSYNCYLKTTMIIGSCQNLIGIPTDAFICDEVLITNFPNQILCLLCPIVLGLTI